LSGPDRYQRFPVEVDIIELLPDLEYRVLYGGQGDLWADFIEMTPIEVMVPVAIYEAKSLSSDYAASAAASDALCRDLQRGNGEPARAATPSMEHPPGKNALIYGPYARLIPGKYRARFSLKDGRPLAEGGDLGGTERNSILDDDTVARVATLEVLANGRTLASREITGTDFQTAGEYQPLDVDFAAGEPLRDVEYRVLYAGNGTLCVDRVSVSYLYGLEDK
jgi:hypothetical protein